MGGRTPLGNDPKRKRFQESVSIEHSENRMESAARRLAAETLKLLRGEAKVRARPCCCPKSEVDSRRAQPPPRGPGASERARSPPHPRRWQEPPPAHAQPSPRQRLRPPAAPTTVTLTCLRCTALHPSFPIALRSRSSSVSAAAAAAAAVTVAAATHRALHSPVPRSPLNARSRARPSSRVRPAIR